MYKYKWVLIFAILPVVTMGQSLTPTEDTSFKDSIGIDTDGDGTYESYIYPSFIQEGANITLGVAGDTLKISGPAGSGTADSMGVDTDGDGTVDNYLYSTTAGAFHLKEGANITFTVAGDTVTIAGPAASGTADSLAVDVNGDGTIDSYLYSTAGAIAMIQAVASGGIAFSVGTDTLRIQATLGTSINSTEIENQTILRVDIDSTVGVTLGSASYIENSNEADSQIATLEYAQVIAGDSVATALRLAGGTMAGNIVMDNYYITGADVISADSIIIGEDTLYDQHLIAYLMRLRVRNASAATLTAGTPVYISGITGNRPNVDSARADNAVLMPAVGLIEHDISSSADGFIVISGEFGPYNTLAWSVEDPLYVDATGGLTSTKPTGTNLIQKMGIVTRDNAAVGTIQLVGAGRTNDLPNIASANFWLGNGSGVPTAVTMSNDATMDNAGAVTVSDVDTTGTKIAAALGNKMYNVGDTVTGTYNFSGNPLEFIRMIDLDDTITAPSHSEGRVFYDKIDNTLCYYNNEADVTMNLGQEGWVYARNITGSTILDGKIVYITGAVSSRPTIALAQADAEATSKLIGVATHDIETASNGYVTVWGVVRGIDLSDFSDGDEVFLSATVAGSLTTTMPSAPNYVVEVGYVIDASASGDLLVSTGKSKMLNSLGDVLISGPTTGDILVYDGTVWADTNTLTAASPNFTGTTTGDSAQFDGNVNIDSIDVNGAADFLAGLNVSGNKIVADSADFDGNVGADSLDVSGAANFGSDITVNAKTITGNMHWIFNVFSPNLVYDDDTQICIDPRTEAAITVTRIDVTLDADPTTELEYSIKFADAFIGLANATVIEDTATVAGVTTVTSITGDATVPTNKAIYIQFEADPDANITQVSVNVTWDYD